MEEGEGVRGRGPRLRAKLVFLVATTTAAVLAATLYWTIGFFRGHLVRAAGEASSTEGDVLRVVLEQQMLSGDRELVIRAVSEIGREPNIAWVGVLDTEGKVQVSSNPDAVGQVFEESSPDCMICHATEAEKRVRSVTLVRSGGQVLRSVTPLVNWPVCHGCHDPAKRINGVLIVDRLLEPVHRAVISGRDQILIGSVAALVVLLGTLGMGLERLVLRRLHRLRVAARDLGRGNLDARADDKGTDEIGELAHDFNAMAGRLSGAMAKLADDRRQLDELVNGIADGVVLVDTEMKVMAANRAFSARLPADAAPPAGQRHRELARAAGLDLQTTQSPAERALQSGTLEKEIFRLGERFEEIYAQPLRGPDGPVVAVIEVWRDITDRMALEAGLEHSERLAALGMLATGIAHEVGNPLASIATAVEGLLRRMDEPGGAQVAELREYLEIVRKQVFRCHGVTERLLGFAKLPSREVGPVDAAEVARDVLALVAPQARAQGIELKGDLGEPAVALAEDLLLHHVFLNLVLNALKAMPSGGALRLAAFAEGDAVSVVVADTGAGISEEAQRHLFDPLRRTGGRGGTGLGLFLSHTLIRRCGGTITVDSRPGQGATFTVRLKRAPAPAGRGDR